MVKFILILLLSSPLYAKEFAGMLDCEYKPTSEKYELIFIKSFTFVCREYTSNLSTGIVEGWQCYKTSWLAPKSKGCNKKDVFYDKVFSGYDTVLIKRITDVRN